MATDSVGRVSTSIDQSAFTPFVNRPTSRPAASFWRCGYVSGGRHCRASLN